MKVMFRDCAQKCSRKFKEATAISLGCHSVAYSYSYDFSAYSYSYDDGCSDDDFLSKRSFGLSCENIKPFCDKRYAALVSKICPVTCAACSSRCGGDRDAAMTLWATQNEGWPKTCADGA